MQNYYDSIAKSYNELHGEEQKKKLEIIKEHLDINEETVLLDVGCGTGVSSDFDCYVVGVDPSEELLKIAKETHPETTFMKADAESLPFEDKSFDVVVSLTAIQNFNDIEEGLKEIERVGKNQFALSYLKKSAKSEMIEEQINNIFRKYKITRIEEEKDIIFIIKE